MTKSTVCAFALFLEFTSPALSPLEGFTGVFIWICCSLCGTIVVSQTCATINFLLSPPRIPDVPKGERQVKASA